jgi:hypothetical protein
MDGDIRFNVGANTAQFDAKMSGVGNVANTTANKIKSAFSGLGGVLAGGAILAGLKSMMNDFDRVGKLATRFATSAESIQRVGVAAKVAGTDVEAVANAMTKAGIAASKAVEQGGQMAELFDRAGINAREFANVNIDQKLLMIAEAYRAAGNDAQKTNAIIEIMGSRAGGNLIPLISNVETLREEMANVSVATDETVRAIEQANDRMTRFGNSTKVAFAGGLQALTNFSERLGNVLSGGAGFTNNEIDEIIERQNAEGRLRSRGELLPDDSTLRKKAIPTPAGPVYGAEELIAGPNAQENARRIEAEIKAQQELNKAKKEEARLARETADSETEQVSKTQEKTKAESEALKFKQYMLDIDLKIKEAQAAGDKERAESLQKIKDWTEAAIKYEGDLDMAARDVNASLKERLRLKDEELAKQQASIDAELKHVETMAFGTEEAKAKAEWMDEYNRRMGEGATDEQAKRFANAASFKPTSESSFGGGGGGGGGGGLGPSVSGAPMSENMRTADLRGSARQATRNQRASDLAAAGMYRSAIRAQDAGQRAYDRSMQAAADRDMASNFDFAGRPAGNMGEAMKSVQDELGKMEALDRMRNAEGYDPTKGETENMKNAMRAGKFDDALSERAKTPEERKQEEEEARNKSKPPGGGGDGGRPDPTQETGGKLDKIINIMEERLPIRVIGKAA